MKIFEGYLVSIDNRDIVNGKFVVPDGVTIIGDAAFKNCLELTSISIPDSVTYIGNYAFCGCSGLTDIAIHDEITFIGKGAFQDCINLTSVTIGNSVTSIRCETFCGCIGLTSVVIPNSVMRIGYHAFYGCKSLTGINIPDSEVFIETRAFENTGYYNEKSNWENGVLYIGSNLIKAKSSLRGDYTVKNGITNIAESAFNGCKRLTRIEIPDSVRRINRYAFSDCNNLISIKISSSVINIGCCAFLNCYNLKSKQGIYKAFKPNLTCLDYQFKMGEWSNNITYISPCNRGYHYCTNLFDIFSYYYGEYDNDFIVCECEVGYKSIKHHEDSKHVTNKIKPVRKLEWKEILDLMHIKD